MSPKYTLNISGAKDVELRKTTGTKMRMTFQLTISSDGKRYPPYDRLKFLANRIFGDLGVETSSKRCRTWSKIDPEI